MYLSDTHLQLYDIILAIIGRGRAKYRKIPKISPGSYIFQKPFLRGLFLGGGGLYSEGLIYGRKIAFQN